MRVALTGCAEKSDIVERLRNAAGGRSFPDACSELRALSRTVGEMCADARSGLSRCAADDGGGGGAAGVAGGGRGRGGAGAEGG
eukprot:2559484-Rhodomonas_salina.2